jgi:hypothetical protein
LESGQELGDVITPEFQTDGPAHFTQRPNGRRTNHPAKLLFRCAPFYQRIDIVLGTKDQALMARK